MRDIKIMFYIKFDERTVTAHATIMSQLCKVFWQIQNMYEEGLIAEVVEIKVFVPKWIHGRIYSDNHKYALHEQIIWFLDNLEKPRVGIKWSIEYYKEKTQVTSPWNAQCIWPLKKELQWQGGGGYITLQKYNDVSLESSYNYNRAIAENSGHLDVIDNIEAYSEWPVKVIDYTQTQDEFFNILRYSEKHYTYMGGSYYSAALINCPTICYGFPYDDVYPNSLEGNPMRGSAWGQSMGNGFSTICQYDFNKTYNGPQTYVKHTNTVNELKGELLGLYK